MLVCHPSGALEIGEHLLLGASPGVGSSGERRKLLKELEVSSGSVFHSDGTVELVARHWSELPALRGMVYPRSRYDVWCFWLLSSTCFLQPLLELGKALPSR